MKVLLVNTYEKTGGAAVACLRLARALQRAGVCVHVLTVTASQGCEPVVGVATTRLQRWRQRLAFLCERLQIFLHNGFSRKRLFTVSTASAGVSIARHPLVAEADVIHLHWINQGFLSLREVQRLLATGKPVVWTMHDMWPLTAICHYAGTCDSYTTECRACMLLQSHGRDLATRIFHRKQWAYAAAPIHFVACSKWLRNSVAQSALLKPADTLQDIPNPIDTAFFSPGNRDEARRRLGLPQDKRLILFGAVNAADKRKGIDYLIESLCLLHRHYPQWDDSVELVVFGAAQRIPLHRFPYKTTATGYIAAPETIRDIYRAVDVYVTPSLEDNLPNTIMEAMACGVPCVGFEVGGIPEMISPRCGFVARYCDAAHMAQGIDAVLQPAAHEAMAQQARRKVELAYAQDVVAQRFVQLYNTLIKP